MLNERQKTRVYLHLAALQVSASRAERSVIRQAKLDFDHGKYEKVVQIFRSKAEESYEQNATTFELEMLAREMEQAQTGQ